MQLLPLCKGICFHLNDCQYAWKIATHWVRCQSNIKFMVKSHFRNRWYAAVSTCHWGLSWSGIWPLISICPFCLHQYTTHPVTIIDVLVRFQKIVMNNGNGIPRNCLYNILLVKYHFGKIFGWFVTMKPLRRSFSIVRWNIFFITSFYSIKTWIIRIWNTLCPFLFSFRNRLTDICVL